MNAGWVWVLKNLQEIHMQWLWKVRCSQHWTFLQHHCVCPLSFFQPELFLALLSLACFYSQYWASSSFGCRLGMHIIDISSKEVSSSCFDHTQCKLTLSVLLSHTHTHTHTHTMTKANPTVSGLGVKFNTRVKEVVNMTRWTKMFQRLPISYLFHKERDD